MHSQSVAPESHLSPLPTPQPPQLSVMEALLWLGEAKKTRLPLPQLAVKGYGISLGEVDPNHVLSAPPPTFRSEISGKCG